MGIDDLKKYIKRINPSKVFLVRGKQSFSGSGADLFIKDLLEGICYTSFYDFDSNPQLRDLEKGTGLFNKKKYDLIVAIGGGSVLDMAKLISVFSHYPDELNNLEKGKPVLGEQKTPLLAIPTTAGSGAEATHFAVLYIGKTKYSIAHKTILPDAFFLNPELTYSAGAYLTACTGLDAFCHSVESVWSVNAGDESMKYALEAIEIIWGNLKDAVLENSKEAKNKMLTAAHLAGKAINITKTTAPHAISYAFTSFYGIPHGHAVALTLPFFLTYNYHLQESDCTDKRGAGAVKDRIGKILEIIDAEIDTAETKIKQFFNDTGVVIDIGNLIKDFDKELIIKNINTERLKNNPRIVTETAVRSLF